MKSYTLVNPTIEGTIKTAAKADSALEAANEIYSNLSQYFATTVPNFKFTLECAGEYFHCQVEEKIKGDNAHYVLTQYKGNINESEFKKNLAKFKHQEGGKHKKRRDDDSSSSSSSSSSYYTRVRVPISSWWYYPNMYVTSDLVYFPVIASNAVGVSSVIVLQPNVTRVDTSVLVA